MTETERPILAYLACAVVIVCSMVLIVEWLVDG